MEGDPVADAIAQPRLSMAEDGGERVSGAVRRAAGLPSMEHTPDRPSWDCRACHRAWPCGPARKRLRAEFSYFPSVLRIYLVDQLTTAAGELPDAKPAELYERFLAWV